MEINVRDYLPPIVDEENIFIRDKSHNKAAAMNRYIVTNKITKEFFEGINADLSDTKDIPSDLKEKYEKVYLLLVEIMAYESDLAIGVIK